MQASLPQQASCAGRVEMTGCHGGGTNSNWQGWNFMGRALLTQGVFL
jgi:hypothetical protein